ncbi:MAG: hypothetical protein KDA71_24595, partial [Planctomycetales bacterium]|nr:hypothetical protein [Planctomycetales bacterium]
AALSRYNVAIALSRFRRFADARDFAQAALRDFKKFGAAAANEVEDTERLLAEIDQGIQEQGS